MSLLELKYKKMKVEKTIYLIYDMNEPLSVASVNILRAATELKDLPYGTTYQGLVDARKISCSCGYGKPVTLESGESFYFLGSVKMGLVIDPNTNIIKEVSETEYKRDYLKLPDYQV